MRRIVHRRRPDQRGVSLPELMVVIALLALAAMVAIPLTARKVHELRLSSAVNQFETSVRAVRMIAVTTSQAASLDVEADPVNRYSYTMTDGRQHTVELPAGVTIDPVSSPVIIFRSNGSLEPPAPATTIIEAKRPSGLIERWTVETPMSGIPTVTHELLDEGAPPN